MWSGVRRISFASTVLPRPPRAPELCVEIVSPSNSRQEMAEKIALYLDAGAGEVWIVFEDGQIEIHDAGGRREHSAFLDPILLEF